MRTNRQGAADAGEGDDDVSEEGPSAALQAETRRKELERAVNTHVSCVHGVRKKKIGSRCRMYQYSIMFVWGAHPSCQHDPNLGPIGARCPPHVLSKSDGREGRYCL